MSAKVKVWRVRPEARAHFEIKEDTAIMAGNGRNFIVVDQSGTTIRGPVSIAAMGEGQRTGGLWIGTPEWARMFPSTIASPIPQILPVPPLGMVKNITFGVAFGLAFLAG